MNKLLKHKNYYGSVEYDIDEGYLYGKVLFINDAIIYDGNSIDELKQSFENAVDEYLELCKELNKTPDISCTGSFNIRTTPALHRQYQIMAMERGVSMNAVIQQALESYCNLEMPKAVV